MSGYQERIYSHIMEILMRILNLYKNFASGQEEAAAYVILNDIRTDEERKLYNTAIDELITELDNLEKETIKDVSNGKIVPLYYLFKAFDLSLFDKFCFTLAFACASEGSFRRMINIIFDDYSKDYPTAELCSHISCIDHSSSLELCTSFVENFDKQRFLYDNKSNSNGNNILKMPLVVSERIFEFLYDIAGSNNNLNGLIRVQLQSSEYTDMVINERYLEIAENMFRNANASSYLCVYGSEGIGKKTIISNLCKKNRLPVIFVDINRLCYEAVRTDLNILMDLILRESFLKGKALIAFTGYKTDEDDGFLQKLLWAAENKLNFFFVTVNMPELIHIDSSFTLYELKMEEPNYEEQIRLWEYYIAKCGMKCEYDVHEISEKLSEQYSLTPEIIKASTLYAVMKCDSENHEMLMYEALVEGCRRYISHAISQDATQIKATYEMKNLILPESRKKRLQDACNQIKYKNLVYSTWGFADKMAYGRGVSMIFYGPPGTGKTMGAQVMAKELGLELYRVDLSSIMSKYVGESEKKLNNIFEQGKRSQCILFFDEADSLFGKRNEVKDSQDKYANASTAFLLQKIEDYEGIIILATNLLQNFDSAFIRRFKFIIEFPFPDAEQRIEIWKSVYPEKAPMDSIDFDYLAMQFKLSGSQIKNVAYSSMFLAAAEKTAVNMKHILISIKDEMKKTGKTLLESDIGQYYFLIEGLE